MPVYKPIVRRTVTSGSVPFTAMVFGGEVSWSLAQLKGPQGEAFAETLGTTLKAVGAKRVYAPSPVTFNGAMITPQVLRTIIPLGDGVLMYRNPDAPADGTALHTHSEAGVFSAGGCSVIVATHDDQLLFAHAGRDCVLPRKVILGEEPDRPNESIVDSMMQMLTRSQRVEPSGVRVWVFWSIGPEEFAHHFDNEQHGAYNRSLLLYLQQKGYAVHSDRVAVYPDLPTIIAEQFRRHGVPARNVDFGDAYLHNDLPHTRKEEGSANRYLVAIVRN